MILLLPFFLTACLEKVPLIPAGASQVITVTAEGAVSTSYTGRFYYPYDEIGAVVRVLEAAVVKSGKGGPVGETPDRASVENALLSQLQLDFPGLKFEHRGNGFYDLSLSVTRTEPNPGSARILFLGSAAEFGALVEVAADGHLDRNLKELKGAGGGDPENRRSDLAAALSRRTGGQDPGAR